MNANRLKRRLFLLHEIWPTLTGDLLDLPIDLTSAKGPRQLQFRPAHEQAGAIRAEIEQVEKCSLDGGHVAAIIGASKAAK